MRELEVAAIGAADGLVGPRPVVEAAAAQGVKHAAVHTECLNCGAQLHGKFCAVCGQVADDHHRSIFHLMWEAVEGLTHLDGRLAQTLPALFLRPGRLARDHFEGRRQRHVPPFRLFLITLLLFMFSVEAVFHHSGKGEHAPKVMAVTLGQNLTTIDSRGRKRSVQIPSAAEISSWTGGRVSPQQIEAGSAAHQPKPAAAPAAAAKGGVELDDDDEHIDLGPPGLAPPKAVPGGAVTLHPLPKSEQEKVDWIAERIAKARTNPEYFKALVFEWGHRLAILLLPITALLLTAMYFYKRQFYVYDHLIVSMQFLSFCFLLWGIVYVLPKPVNDWAFLAATVWTPFNLYRTLRGAYGSGRIGAAIKAFSLWTATCTLFLVMIVGILAVALGQL